MQKKISNHPQHASLSLVKFRDYTIIHPTQAEEDTWAGEATSKTLYRQRLSIYASFGKENVPGEEEPFQCALRVGVNVFLSVWLQLFVFAFSLLEKLQMISVGDGGTRFSH